VWLMRSRTSFISLSFIFKFDIISNGLGILLTFDHFVQFIATWKSL
jgi:hypothetical protein